jgi:hypothetical protein
MAKPTADIMAESRQELLSAQHFKEELRKQYSAEKKIPMYLSPMYRAYFGSVMTVSINGVKIYFKVDGSTQLIPESYADEITRRRMCIDTQLTKQGRMADIANNAETAPGELKLF